MRIETCQSHAGAEYDKGSEAGPGVAIEGEVWVAVNTHPHKEHVAWENLVRQDITVYCPMFRRSIRHARRTSEVLRPFFPSYVFAVADSHSGRIASLYSTRGVRTVVGSAGRPSRVSGDFIRSLRAREVDGAIARPAQPYVIGQNVRLTGGAFEGLVAKIIDLDDKQRLTVLMELLNQTVRVRTAGEYVMPI